MDQGSFCLKHLTRWIFIALVLGIIVGVLLHSVKGSGVYNTVYDITELLGKIFINILKMLVVPVVLVSLVTGTCQLKSGKQLGRFAFKSILLYVITTAVAIFLALLIASLFKIGAHATITKVTNFAIQSPPSIESVILNIFPSNPFKALSDGNMLQIIVFSILLGGAISLAGSSGKMIADFFVSFHDVLIKLISIVLWFAPYGVFCLVAALFARTGFSLVGSLIGYFATVLIVLFIHWLVVYGFIVKFMAKQSPLRFYRRVFFSDVFCV